MGRSSAPSARHRLPGATPGGAVVGGGDAGATCPGRATSSLIRLQTRDLTSLLLRLLTCRAGPIMFPHPGPCAKLL